MPRIPASKAHIWGAKHGCRGYSSMVSRVPRRSDTTKAQEGTRVHGIAGSVLLGDVPPVGLEPDMVGAIQIYVDDVFAVTTAPNVESKLPAPRIHGASNPVVDAWWYDGMDTVYIWDFKYGREVVEAFENMQLVNYAAAVLDHLNLWPQGNRTLVVMRIIQPRAHHEDGVVREWSAIASSLRPYFNNLRNAAGEIMDAGCTTTRSGDHCKNCEARHTCPTAIRAGLRMYEMATDAPPLNMTPEQLGAHCAMVKRAKRMLDSLDTGLTAQVEAVINSGTTVPGFKHGFGRGGEGWTVEDSVVENMGLYYKAGDTMKHKPFTPKQARDAGIPSDTVALFSRRYPGKPQLKPNTNTRAREIFNSLLTEDK